MEQELERRIVQVLPQQQWVREEEQIGMINKSAAALRL